MLVADEIDRISAAIETAIEEGANLVVTTGGTGISARDVTPEATNELAEKHLPGFGELMRSKSLEKVATAPLSRAQAVVVRKALVINVPGSPSAAVENLDAIAHLISHALELISGKTSHEEKEN